MIWLPISHLTLCATTPLGVFLVPSKSLPHSQLRAFAMGVLLPRMFFPQISACLTLSLPLSLNSKVSQSWHYCHFGVDNSLLWWGCSVHCKMFNSIPNIYPPLLHHHCAWYLQIQSFYEFIFYWEKNTPVSFSFLVEWGCLPVLCPDFLTKPCFLTLFSASSLPLPVPSTFKFESSLGLYEQISLTSHQLSLCRQSKYSFLHLRKSVVTPICFPSSKTLLSLSFLSLSLFFHLFIQQILLSTHKCQALF